MERRYQAKKNFLHRKVAKNDVLISVGSNVANFNGYIELNPTASCLWDCLAEGRTLEELAAKLQEQFDVDVETSRADAQEFVDALLAREMIEVVA